MRRPWGDRSGPPAWHCPQTPDSIAQALYDAWEKDGDPETAAEALGDLARCAMRLSERKEAA